MLLQREMPGHIACRVCARFHSMELDEYAKSPPSLDGYVNRKGKRVQPQCVIKDIHLFLWESIHPNFCSSVFQMVMKRHQLGLDYQAYLDILGGTQGPHCQAKYKRGPSYCWKTTALAKIIAGSLLIRTRKYQMIPLQGVGDLPFWFNTCPHFTSLGLSWTGDIESWNSIIPSCHQSMCFFARKKD
jgi:hypothetical protein